MLSRFVFVWFAALLGAQGWALAQGVAAGTSGRNAQLSREEVRQCLQLQVALEKDKDALSEARARQDATIKALDTKEAELKATQAKLDRSNPQAVSAFNAQLKTHRERVAAHNQTLPAFNAQAAAFEAGEARYRARCAGKTYREADRTTVQP